MRFFDNDTKKPNAYREPRGVPDEIKRWQIARFAKCDPAFGAGVAKAVELEPGIN